MIIKKQCCQPNCECCIKENEHLSSNCENYIPVITIDGPTASGKGTIGRLLAQRLNWHFLDSGILYRVLAFTALRCKISFEDVLALRDLAINLKVEVLDALGQPQKIMYCGEDISIDIRQEQCGIYASKIASLLEIRNALLYCLQSFRKFPGLVADGRDMGTLVFPDASLKIFLTAASEKRAWRRWQQLQNKNISVSVREVEFDLIARDKRDETREVAPLKPAFDAKIVDTTDLTIDEVLKNILAFFCNSESLVKEIKDNN